MGHDVFISYSRRDTKVADEICKVLDEAGISYWIDRGGITSGEAFHAVIVQAIRNY
ncbi:MAG: toll/interleukin-1 receptor domain-containing protein [Candidatus Symbiothrix sp.]|nr:toll/interleukin-1 receptor domain-containing protein [Candidatus Symbiothrix sp.]